MEGVVLTVFWGMFCPEQCQGFLPTPFPTLPACRITRNLGSQKFEPTVIVSVDNAYYVM